MKTPQKILFALLLISGTLLLACCKTETITVCDGWRMHGANAADTVFQATKIKFY